MIDKQAPSYRNQMEDTFAARWDTLSKDLSETPKMELLLLDARDKFIDTCTWEELEEETLDYMD